MILDPCNPKKEKEEEKKKEEQEANKRETGGRVYGRN